MVYNRIFCSVILAACSLLLNAEVLKQGAQQLKQSHEQGVLHLDWMDLTMPPGQNFYAYANGYWQQANPIPKAYARWDNFRILHEAMEKKLNDMMSGLASHSQLKPGTIQQKIGDFYYSGMNQSALNRERYYPLNPLLQKINAVSTLSDLQALIPELQLIGVNVLFSFGSQQDFKNSQAMIAAAVQGGLGLPDRDYYCLNDPKFVQIRERYRQHIARVFQLVGETPAEAAHDAATIMTIETALAKASLTQIEQRDPYAIYHKMSLAKLAQLTPHFAWQPYLHRLQIAEVKEVNVGMPLFFRALDSLLVSTLLVDWKVYFRWHLLNAFSAYLSDEFVSEDFTMNKALTGAEVLRPRWQRVVDTVNNALDFAVGKFYVENYFSEASKQKVIVMIANIRETFRNVLQNQPWMEAKTRKAALQKLDMMTERAGYPNHWRNYSSLLINRNHYVLNVMRAVEFNNRYDLAKIGKPVDRNEWSMSPQTINAYYDPSMNSITILAGILQPPFFDPNAPAAVNYGAIGFVIGHEMTHGFDDQGALFDGHGNLKNWWTAQDMKQFKALTACISNQFSHYKIDGDIAVQGPLVEGEATADLGGVLLAYQAFHASKDYQNSKMIDGFTPSQQFFLSVAHV
ncbi:MAG: metallopeptidase, partial [Legionellales bacterium RIFCSPHIGHO2_12_FULL_42_9]